VTDVVDDATSTWSTSGTCPGTWGIRRTSDQSPFYLGR
jgi:hypothetical protein